MPYPPPSFIRGASPGYEHKDELSRCTTGLPFDKLEPDTLDSMTRSGHVSQIEHAKRARSPPFPDTSDDSSDDDLEPINPPPNLKILYRHAKRAKPYSTPYKRDGLNIFERRFFDNQLLQHGSNNRVGIQRGQKILEHRVEGLSSRARAQAAITKDADVEWRRLCAITTAWEIHAREQHLKYLHILFQDQYEMHANATSESLDNAIKELAGSSKEELEDSISAGAAAYNHDVKAFFVGDAQFDLIESAIAGIGPDKSDVTAEPQGILPMIAETTADPGK